MLSQQLQIRLFVNHLSYTIFYFIFLACDHTSPLQELIEENQQDVEVYFKDHTVDDDNICLLAEASKLNPKWNRMDLWNNGLGPESADYINQILQKFKLSYLHLGRNSIRSEGIRRLSALRNNKYLTELDLWSTDLFDEGMITLAKVLPTTGLQILNLGVNGIGFRGCHALFTNLPPDLYDLNLYSNRIGESCVKFIMAAISKGKLQKLNLEAQQNELWTTNSKQKLLRFAKERGCVVKI